MDLYHIVLFVHILALLVAVAATAITKLAAARRAKARTIGDVIEWHNTLTGAARAFPIVLVVFVLTGGFMTSRSGIPMSTGFVVAGLVGVVLLLASGIYLGMKGKAFSAVLQQMAAAKGADAPAPKMVPPTLLVTLPVINTMLALSVAFDMVTKPTSILTALTVVGAGILLGAAIGFREASPAAAKAPAA